MARARNVLFQEHVGDAEGVARLAPRLIEGVVEFVGGERDAHAATAAAHRRLDDERIAEFFRQRARLVVGRDGALAARQDGNAGLPGDAPRHDLVAQPFEDIDARTDEYQPGVAAGAGEGGVLRQEAVAGVDGIDFVAFRQGDDAGDVEVGADRLAGLAGAVGFVGLEAVQGEAVLVGVDRHRADAQLGGGAKDADRDLAAVGDEELLNGRGRRGEAVPPAWLACPRRECGRAV